MSTTPETRWVAGSALIATLFFICFPQFDLLVAQWLYQGTIKSYTWCIWVSSKLVPTITHCIIGFLIMVFVRLVANFFFPDETLSSLYEIPWRVYVAVMEGSAAETDGDSNIINRAG